MIDIRVYREKKIVTIFYPINRGNKLERLYIFLAPGENGADYKLLEIAQIKGPFSMSQGIREWQKQVEEIGL